MSSKTTARRSTVQSKKRKRNKSQIKRFVLNLNATEILNVISFLGFGLAILCISFLGQVNEPRPLILKEYARERIVAEFPFEYKSVLATQAKAALIQARTPPIFNHTDVPYKRFLQFIELIENLHAKYEIAQSKDNASELSSLSEFFSEQLKLENDVPAVDPSLIAQFYNQSTSRERNKLFKACTSILTELYATGIYDARMHELLKTKNIFISISNLSEDKELEFSPLTYEDALAQLKLKINVIAKDNSQAQELFKFYQHGLKPNLIFSEKETQSAIDQAIADLEPTLFKFSQGETLIAPGQLITDLDIEKIKAYATAEKERVGDNLIFNELFLQRSFITFILLVILYLFIRYGLKDSPRRTTILAVSATAIILNLILSRLVLEFGSLIFQNNEALLALLPNFIPIALAPILIAVLVGALPGILSALVISILFCLGFENSLEQWLITFLPGIVGVYAAYNTRSRSKLLRAGLMTGLISAFGFTVVSLLNENSLTFISQQVFTSIGIGLITGVIAVGLISAFEQIFQITTSITLLELTDFNHPILRKMQLEAPGTYHHSLMVANLSENAADAIGSNPLLCRVCCLFHDIGKLVKPEYFSENQRGDNPHDEKNPSMSALVIKAHVKEGVEIARQEKLPKVIIDVIQQHHGTSLIKYFYHQAQKQRHTDQEEKVHKFGDSQHANDPLNQSTYRYDGPRPRFKESAIIFFADAVEATSRSLKKISQPAVEEMIDTLFESRIKDGQLDECPLTFVELNQIKTSFTRTLLNMLHSRVEYPKDSEIESVE
ncbi:MAG: HDIG domain-containing protein [Puniceicoccaceae bacterium]|nr:MAG: HDIG domain-containing protein [Puniceicoccaceae bacterium]